MDRLGRLFRIFTRRLPLGMVLFALVDAISQRDTDWDYRMVIAQGWSIGQKCSGVAPIVYKPSGNICLTNQAPGVSVLIGSFVTGMALYGPYYTGAGILRHRTAVTFVRPTPSIASPYKPKFWPTPDIFTPPDPTPWIDPLRPPLTPEVKPSPPPYPVIPHIPTTDPNRPPGEQPDRGEEPSTPPWVKPKPDTEFVYDPPSPDKPEVKKPRPVQVYAPKRAERRTKERKTLVMGLSPQNLLMQLYNAATETEDFVDVMILSMDKKTIAEWHRSRLRKEYRDIRGNFVNRVKWTYKRATLQEKMAFVYDNLDKVDTEKLFYGLLDESQEDKIYGTLGKSVAKANQKRNVPAGLTFGPAL